jgi:hypothetical protein
VYWQDYTGDEIRVMRSRWWSFTNEPKTRKSRAPIPVILTSRIIEVSFWFGHCESIFFMIRSAIASALAIVFSTAGEGHPSQSAR